MSIVYGLIYGGLSKCILSFHGDNNIAMARNGFAKQALDMGAEWLFFVDSDMDFPTNTLERLKAMDADIACVDMWSRNWPSFRTVLEYGPKRGKLKELVPVAMGEKVIGVRDVDCCGMACTLIKTSLLEKFAKKKIMPFVMGVHGEDASFCMVAKQKFKATIRCDFDIVAGHWGRARMAGQDFTRDAMNQTGTVADPEMMRRMGIKNLEQAMERGTRIGREDSTKP
jgi:hypothetical protein